jgi:hypothetical protein
MTRRHTPQRLTLDAILPHLRTKRVSKRNGERHVLAHCPAHDDANPSLSLTEKARRHAAVEVLRGLLRRRLCARRWSDWQACSPQPPARLRLAEIGSSLQPHRRNR